MKKWLKITIGIVCTIIILLVISVYILINKGYGMSVGRYLEAKNGKAMFIRDKSPISMHNRTNWELYGNLDTGDKIFVIHTGIAESYPGQTGVYAVFKLSKGTIADIPQRVIKELIRLGWIDPVDMPISLEDVNIKIQEYFELEKADRSNFKNNYIDRVKDVVVVELIDNSKTKQEEFIYKVFSNSTGSKYIQYITDNNMIEFRETGVSGSAYSE